MKVILLVLYALAAAFSAPIPCAHALEGGHVLEDGLAAADSHDEFHDHPMMLMQDKTDQHDMQHHMAEHDAHNPDAMSGHKSGHEIGHGDCEQNCMGGAGCEGCISITASLTKTAFFKQAQIDHTRYATCVGSGDSISAAIEPPPPRL